MSLPDSEAADWGAWLDRFEREVWPVFERRGYSKETAALIYFTRIPDAPPTLDDEEDEE
jgi:hypothetical protein